MGFFSVYPLISLPLIVVPLPLTVGLGLGLLLPEDVPPEDVPFEDVPPEDVLLPEEDVPFPDTVPLPLTVEESELFAEFPLTLEAFSVSGSKSGKEYVKSLSSSATSI